MRYDKTSNDSEGVVLESLEWIYKIHVNECLEVCVSHMCPYFSLDKYLHYCKQANQLSYDILNYHLKIAYVQTLCLVFADETSKLQQIIQNKLFTKL